jgi:hypothetical protein
MKTSACCVKYVNTAAPYVFFLKTTTNFKPSENNVADVLEDSAVLTFHDLLLMMFLLKANTVEGKAETVW